METVKTKVCSDSRCCDSIAVDTLVHSPYGGCSSVGFSRPMVERKYRDCRRAVQTPPRGCSDTMADSLASMLPSLRRNRVLLPSIGSIPYIASSLGKTPRSINTIPLRLFQAKPLQLGTEILTPFQIPVNAHRTFAPSHNRYKLANEAKVVKIPRIEIL